LFCISMMVSFTLIPLKIISATLLSSSNNVVDVSQHQ
jgi:hypothetical protein